MDCTFDILFKFDIVHSFFFACLLYTPECATMESHNCTILHDLHPLSCLYWLLWIMSLPEHWLSILQLKPWIIAINRHLLIQMVPVHIIFKSNHLLVASLLFARAFYSRLLIWVVLPWHELLCCDRLMIWDGCNLALLTYSLLISSSQHLHLRLR